jgi:hypothetical protein
MKRTRDLQSWRENSHQAKAQSTIHSLAGSETTADFVDDDDDIQYSSLILSAVC